MTLRLITCLEQTGREPVLINRDFSQKVSDVGSFSVSKLCKIPWLLARAARTWTRLKGSPCVFFITNRPGAFLVDSALLTLARLLKVSVVLYVHTVGFNNLAARGPLWAWLVRKAMSSASLAVTLGPSLVADISGWVDPARVRIIANTPGKCPRLRPATTIKQVLFLSNLLPEKGPEDFIKACDAIHERLPDVRFVMAGAPSDATTFDRVRHSVYASQSRGTPISLLGAVDEMQRWNLLSESTLLLFPSTYLYEAQPLTIAESFAAGTPVLGYDTGGLRDMIDAQFIVPQADWLQLADIAVDLLSDDAKLAAARYIVSESFESSFTEEIYQASWSHLLDEL